MHSTDLNYRFADIIRGILERVGEDCRSPISADQILHRESMAHQERNVAWPQRLVVEILQAFPPGGNLVLVTKFKIVYKKQLHGTIHLQTSIDALQEAAHEPTGRQPAHQLPRDFEEIRKDFGVIDSLSENQELLVVRSEVMH